MLNPSLLEALQGYLRLPLLVLDDKLQVMSGYSFREEVLADGCLIESLEKISRKATGIVSYCLIKDRSKGLLLVASYHHYLILFGPFRSPSIEKPAAFVLKEVLLESGGQAVLSASSIRPLKETLLLVDYFLRADLYQYRKFQVEHLAEGISSELTDQESHEILSQEASLNQDLLDYELELLDCVKKGQTTELRALLSPEGKYRHLRYELGRKDLRQQKNYAIIIFEKLSQLAISMGLDRASIYRLRDHYISKGEECQSSYDLWVLQESAILLITQKIDSGGNHSYLVANILKYIEKHLSTRMTISEIARHFNFSESNIRKLFKREMDCSIQQYISKRKIEAAKLLLKKSNSVTDISNALGYSDVSHFSRVFKMEVGISPKQYQLSCIKDII
ncbi:YSIRK-targeted surface antigen transcriptional regulator [Streptococcus didelphis]|uniref:YSIRK-targeted surface antigen transcriptional regulator n=1 Tax=Streptococcus didelphis TaxID=102886 RepID=A0ABY9LHV0_9STRE|nr:YSIRK-targeted surface antigen transcriptional regulator [Streptococcus didelphis]WMB28477.1 YSIRK-targeted surface antigen transcriptional regulator [Streptococcus didelphis]